MEETSTANPPPKRRCVLDPSTIVPVPIYSNKVNRSLKLKAPGSSERKATGHSPDDIFWPKFSCDQKSVPTVELSDSDDETEPKAVEPVTKRDLLRSPSPPPPADSPVPKPSRSVKKKFKEIDRQLQAMNAILSPVDNSQQQRRGSRRSAREKYNANGPHITPAEDDDVIIISPALTGSELQVEREFPLKIRCRDKILKIPVLLSTPLQVVVEQLSVTLSVPPPRLLLLREEAELSPDATMLELGLGIADIIECVVIADKVEDADGIIKVRLQSKDRSAVKEFSLHKDAPLGSVFSQYLSTVPGGAKKVRFHFDGSKLSPKQTPAQLDMEDGDIIEVWT